MPYRKIGCSGWSYKQWVGPFYPPGTRQEDYLKLYSRIFDAVEVDSTFYGIPSVETVEKWYKTTPDDFTFYPKFPQEITHSPSTNDIEAKIEAFLASIDGLGKKLGTVLIQFPSNFKYPSGSEKLHRIMRSLPGGYRYAIEFRDCSWFSRPTISEIQSMGIVIVWSETPFLRDQPLPVSNSIYLRLVGDRSIKETDFGKVKIDQSEKIEFWAKRIKESLDGIQDFVVFANNHFQGFSPATVNAFRSALGMAVLDWKRVFEESSRNLNGSLYSRWD